MMSGMSNTMNRHRTKVSGSCCCVLCCCVLYCSVLCCCVPCCCMLCCVSSISVLSAQHMRLDMRNPDNRVLGIWVPTVSATVSLCDREGLSKYSAYRLLADLSICNCDWLQLTVTIVPVTLMCLSRFQSTGVYINNISCWISLRHF